jgi:hypothetical protein
LAFPGVPALQFSVGSASSGVSVLVHEKPIEGGSQPLTVESSPQLLVDGKAGAQQYSSKPELSWTGLLQMSVGSLSSGLSPPVQE